MGRYRVCVERRETLVGTKIRAKISENNKYWISKHRYYELKHFCLQYLDWKKAYAGIDNLAVSNSNLDKISSNSISDITSKCAVAKVEYAEKMDMIENAAKAADPDLWQYILKAVTEDLSFTYLKSRLEIPCGRDMYYDRYRRFFWILSKERG